MSRRDNAEIPVPESERTPDQEGWEAAYEEGAAHWATDLVPSLLAQMFAAEVRATGARRVIEIGCGNGRDSIFFTRAGFDVTGIDSAPSAVALAEKNAGDAGVSTRFEVGDAERLRFDDGSFDAAFSLSVLHSTDLARSLAEVSRVLANGGLFTVFIYADTEQADGSIETHSTVDDFAKLIMGAGFILLDFYTECEEEFDASGERHGILVATAEKKSDA
jgi:ubiquinone/menaquinone biosynthesis C-methylase UbiE